MSCFGGSSVEIVVVWVLYSSLYRVAGNISRDVLPVAAITGISFADCSSCGASMLENEYVRLIRFHLSPWSVQRPRRRAIC